MSPAKAKNSDPFLNAQQKRIVASALTLIAMAVIVFVVLRVFQYVVEFFELFGNVLMPVLVAGLIALILKPYYNFLIDRLRIRAILAVLVVFLTVIVPIATFFAFFGGKVAGQLEELFSSIPALVSDTRQWIDKQEKNPELKNLLVKYDVETRAKQFLSEKGDLIIEWSRKIALGTVRTGANAFRSLVGWANWFVMPIYLIFLLMAKPVHKEDMEGLLPFCKEETRRDIIYLGEEFVNQVVTFFRGQFIIAFAQGFLYGLGFSLVGLKYGFVLGMLLGLLNIIPYLGSMIGLAIALPLAFFQPGGGPLLLGLIVVVFLVVQNIEGYILTPKIMGDKTGLHPMAIMVALFFWGTALGGITGMILAIPLTAFLVSVWKLLKNNYFKEVI